MNSQEERLALKRQRIKARKRQQIWRNIIVGLVMFIVGISAGVGVTYQQGGEFRQYSQEWDIPDPVHYEAWARERIHAAKSSEGDSYNLRVRKRALRGTYRNLIKCSALMEMILQQIEDRERVIIQVYGREHVAD